MRSPSWHWHWQLAALLSCVAVLVSCGAPATPTAVKLRTPTAIPPTVTPQIPPPGIGNVIPAPVSVTAAGGIFFLTAGTGIYVDPGTDEVLAIGQYLADRLNPSTGYGIQVRTAPDTPSAGNIYLSLTGADPALGDEGYELTITPQLVILVANKPAGLFYGVQTIRQLLPAAIESRSLQPGPWAMGTGTIRDTPRFAWRGTMLDVARHFFGVEDVKQYIDELAVYKINHLHLHLANDQGWRIEIKSWPDLTTIGGSTEVGGGPGGFYTQADYAEIVAYARSRYITIVPEIDMPGHVNAALASYPELNCSGVAPGLYTGIDVGFSSLCMEKDITYQFAFDVIEELSAITPGPYIHIGGDEAMATSEAGYIGFIQFLEGAARTHGKQVIGWEEIAKAKLPDTAVAQHWNPGEGLAEWAVKQGARVIMSPADKAYLDMKYDPSTSLGLIWAGYVSVQTAYSWDPAAMVSGVGESDILGVEAPLWSETLETLSDIETMAFPRIIGYAEIGWSPQASRNWSDYRIRLAEQGPRLEALGINYYKSPEVAWK